MSGIDEVKWIKLNAVIDDRGTLTAIESGRDIPFEIKRIFYVHSTITDRGGHAHRNTQQVLIAVAGKLNVRFTDGEKNCEYHLDDPNMGLYMPPMIFVELVDFTDGGVCLVLANTHYNINASLRTKEEFFKELRTSHE